MAEKLKAQARVILKRLGDSEGSFFFHVMAVNKLGFDRCYELASHALLMYREGRIRTTAPRYYNGCVMKEIELRKSKV